MPFTSSPPDLAIYKLTLLTSSFILVPLSASFVILAFFAHLRFQCFSQAIMSFCLINSHLICFGLLSLSTATSILTDGRSLIICINRSNKVLSKIFETFFLVTFASLQWSADCQRIVYIAEKKEKKLCSFFDQGGPSFAAI